MADQIKESVKKTYFLPKAKYDSFRQEVQDMTPKQKAFLIIKVAKWLLEAIGVRFMSDCHVYWFSYAAGFAVALYLFLASYTLIYYAYHNQFATGIKGTCVGMNKLSF